MNRGTMCVLALTILFMITVVDHSSGPISPALSHGANPDSANNGVLAAGQPPYTGTGAARTVTLKGMVTNMSAGPLMVDSASVDYARVSVPSGWTGTYVRSDINMMSMWSGEALNNGKLDNYHDELWLGMNYDSEAVTVPDYWTLVKSESGTGSGRELHPLHGIFELNAWAGDGYGGSGSMGWLFEAVWSSGNVLTANDEVYLSQQVEVARRDIFSARVTFMYNVYSSSSMQNQTHLFVRIGSSVTKLYVLEGTDAQSTWLRASVDIPVSAFLTTTVPCQLLLDVGLATDLSGSQASGRTSQVFIDEIEFLLQVRPFPEQIALKANGTSLTGSTSGSVSPYVPDDASRDCYDDISTGVDLDGYSNNGVLDVGHWDSSTWNVASTYQVGLQFPLSLPKGAGITSAYLEVEAAGTSNTPGMRIYIADADTVSAFTSGLPHLENRYTWVQTSVNWYPTAWTTDVRYASPDISGLIQKVVTRSGWSSGNYICVMLNFTYSSYYQCTNGIKGTLGYSGGDRARLFVNYVTPNALPEKYATSGTWTGPKTVSVAYTTTSTPVVTLDTITSMNVTSTQQTLNDALGIGTTFSVTNNSLTTWTANVLVSPPAGVGYTNISFSKPSTWTLVSVTDADGSTRTSEVTTTTTEVRVKSSVVDVFGIWKFAFTTSNGATNLQCGVNAGGYANTYTYSVGSSACFRGSAPNITNSAMRLLLTNPSGQLFYAADDLTQDGSLNFEWTGITVTSSWPAGLWSADVNLNNTKGAYPSIVGRYSRLFTVKHATSLVLTSPGDALDDQISARIAGEVLYVEVKLVDSDNGALVSGSTVTMNWTVSGTPTQVTLDDKGNGYYGKALNTTDLVKAMRWRINISSARQYYYDSSTYFYLDLSHSTYIIYQTPPAAPYNDDFLVKVTLIDAFNGTRYSGATITSNRTIVGVPTDYGNGTYLVTLETAGLNVGEYVYRITATPNKAYIVASSVNIRFTLRNIYTAIYGVGGNSLNTPYTIDTSMRIVFNDTDHSFAGITGASWSAQNPTGITATVTELSGGAYRVDIDVGTQTPGTKMVNITLSKANYYSSTIRIVLVLDPHDTYITAECSTNVRWGSNSVFTVRWYDQSMGGTQVSSGLDHITVSGSPGSQNFATFSFTLVTSSWTVGTYQLNVSLYSSTINYRNTWTLTNITVRAHRTSVRVSAGPVTAWGFNSPITVVFWDLDTNSSVPLSNVTTNGIAFNAGTYGVQQFTTYTPTLVTSGWTVGTFSVTLTVTCMQTNKFYDSATSNFNVVIRAHHTAVSVGSGPIVPWGSNSPVTVAFRDLDTGGNVPIANVSNIQFTPSGHSGQNFVTYTPTLITSNWDVSIANTGVAVTCVATNKFYDSASNSFDITIRAHRTTVSVQSAPVTPWGVNSPVTVVFWDTDTSAAVPIANVSDIAISPTGYSTQNFNTYTPTIVTSTWTTGAVSTTITVTSATSNKYYTSASNTFTITIRAHRTSVVASVSGPTAWSLNTPVTIVFLDLDTSTAVPIANVSNIAVSPTGYSTQNFNTYAPTVVTNTWTVGSVSTSISVTCISSNKWYDSASNSFTITIRAHRTTVSASAASSTAWGFNTPVSVVFWDTDTGSSVPIANVTNIQFSPSGYSVQNFAVYSPTLVTTSWAVSTVSVGVSVTCVSSNKYYDTASNTFGVTVRAHRTTVTVGQAPVTAWGFNTPLSVIFRDVDTGSVVPIANVSNIAVSPTGYSVQNFNTYGPTLVTSSWTVGSVSTTISATCVTTNKWYDAASNSFTVTIRAHYTTVSASVSGPTAWGFNTPATIVFWDTDTSAAVPIANVSTIAISPTGHSTQNFVTYSPSIVTSTWTVGPVTTSITVTCVSTNKYYTSASSTFMITIRAHHTTVTVTGSLMSPFGNNTPVSVVLRDVDLGVQVPIANVSNLQFSPVGYGVQNFLTYSPTLSTSTWAVGITSVTLTATCVGSNQYYDSATCSLQLRIRSLGVYLYNEPSDLIFPNGDNLVIVLRVNVSESGNQYDMDPITGLTQSEFMAQNSTYTYPKSIVDLGDGRYRLTIDKSYFRQGTYTVTITVIPTSANYDSDQLVITFMYRPARSFLSSPAYPLVVTPYATDVTVTLNYTDVDRGIGITTGTITATSITVYSKLNLGSGIYRVTLNVTGIAKGDHLFNLTASAPDYELKTLTFTLRVRIAYTTAIPTVGALDIPVGNSPIFYVEYRDTDHNVPIQGATITTTWIHTPTITYVPAEQRYRVVFPTLDTDTLEQNRIVRFNFSKGENYQFGIFNITITIRTHNTDFRLVSAVEPTSYKGLINISLYYGDLDNNAGIQSRYVYHRVVNSTGSVSSTLYNDTVLGAGFYIVRIPASQFGGLGLRTFTIYFNWTGTVYKFFNRTLLASANIIGEDSKYTLITGSEPTPYLGNMSYTFLYAELYSGLGITNITQNVHVYVRFQGETVDLSKVATWETNRGVYPGYYSIRFNTTLFGKTGLIYMSVFVNWSKGASPFYTNRTDTISVRILPRDTLVSVIPPSPTSHSEIATFSFSFDDVTGGSSVPIANSSKLLISVSLAAYNIYYNLSTRTFRVSFNTSQSPVGDYPLGQKSFTLSVTWSGAPYYANRTGRAIFITVTARQTVLEYQSPAPTPYRDNVTFSVIWTDVTGSTSKGITGATVKLYDGATLISSAYYKVTQVGGGQYSIVFNTTYYATPGSRNLNVTVTSSLFYIPKSTAVRLFYVMQRVALLSSEPVGRVAYNSSIEVILHYQDLMTLTNIGNTTGLTHLTILNGTSWLYHIQWENALGYYVLTVQTYNHPELVLGKTYVLRLNATYAYQAPYYGWDDAIVEFSLRARSSSLELTVAPLPTQYLDYVNFTVYYWDVDGPAGISGGSITVYKGGLPLQLGVDYTVTPGAPGYRAISLKTTVLGGIGSAQIVVRANWTAGTPYHGNATLPVSVSTVRRQTNVEIIVPPSQTMYLDNLTFTFAYVDLSTGQFITIGSSNIVVYNGLVVLGPSQFSMKQVGSYFEVSINSTIISSGLVTNRNVTIAVDWNDATAPYYKDDQTSLRVTTTHRIGSVSIGQVQDTPMGDLMNLTFSYADQATGRGIKDAIILFDCIEVPGLIQGSDYWVTRGAGVDAGNYTISVDTEVLGSIATFSFSLGIRWNPSLSPYYQNATMLQIKGSVRLIQASIAYSAPSPVTVPINDNVSVVVTFIDTDHNVAVNGAGVDIAVVYKSTLKAPAVWGWKSLGNGQYNITVDTSDAPAITTTIIVISVDHYPYVKVEAQVSFQIRLRIDVISVETMPNATYAGDSTYVIVKLIDADAKDLPLDGATLTLVWPDPMKGWTALSGGLYNISLGSSTLVYGVKTLEIQTILGNYSPQTISLAIDLRPVTTTLLSPQEYYVVNWTESQDVYVYFNDTVHNRPVLSPSLSVYCVWASKHVDLKPVAGSPGQYVASFDTREVNAGTVVVRITATAPNYLAATTQVTLSILPLPVEIRPVDGRFVLSLDRGKNASISVYLHDSHNGRNVTGAAVSYGWAYGSGSINETGLPGHYGVLLTTVASEVDTYSVLVAGILKNYLISSTTFTIEIKQATVFVELTASNRTIEDRTFYWSEQVFIAVWVYAPDITNVTESNRTDCVTNWYLLANGVQEGTGALRNGLGLVGPGYYFLLLNTSDYSAGTYTLRISAKPLALAYGSNSTTTTISIRNIRASVSDPIVDNFIWGGSRLLLFNYSDTDRDLFILNATVTYELGSFKGNALDLGNGSYGVFVDSSLLPTDIRTSLTVNFDKSNFESIKRTMLLRVTDIPTRVDVYSPSDNQIQNDTKNLQVPYGDIIEIILFYSSTASPSETPYVGGIAGVDANREINGPGVLGGYIALDDRGLGYYSFMFNTTLYIIDPEQYTLKFVFSPENYTKVSVTVTIHIIRVPTAAALVGFEEGFTMFFGDSRDIVLNFTDVWPSHGRVGVSNANLSSVEITTTGALTISVLGGVPGQDGNYRVNILSPRGLFPPTKEVVVTIEFTFERANYTTSSVRMTVTLVLSQSDIMWWNIVGLVTPISVLAMSFLILWVKVFSVPKRLRQINGQIKALRKGRMPKPVDEAKSRQQLVTDLFNDTFVELSLTRTVDQMPAESVAIAIPEMGELLVQLSLLTHLNQQELDDFKADISKMKMSEQAAFVKEVITQEALRVARREGKTVEQVLEGLRTQVTRRLGDEKVVEEVTTEVIEEPVILTREKKVVEKVPTPPEKETPKPTRPVAEEAVPLGDKLSPFELAELKKQLEAKGVPANEIDTIMEQAKQLPRDLVEELVKSITGGG